MRSALLLAEGQRTQPTPAACAPAARPGSSPSPAEPAGLFRRILIALHLDHKETP
jgi:hypothetical protein